MFEQILKPVLVRHQSTDEYFRLIFTEFLLNWFVDQQNVSIDHCHRTSIAAQTQIAIQEELYILFYNAIIFGKRNYNIMVYRLCLQYVFRHGV